MKNRNAYANVNNGMFGFNNSNGANHFWTVRKPLIEFEEGIISIVQNAYNRDNLPFNIILINSTNIIHAGKVYPDEAILDLNNHYDGIDLNTVRNGNYIVGNENSQSIVIAVDPDVVVFALDIESMTKLQSKTLLPLNMSRNNFVRLPNDTLDIYMMDGDSYYKLSDEAGKEVIAIYNEQVAREKL